MIVAKVLPLRFWINVRVEILGRPGIQVEVALVRLLCTCSLLLLGRLRTLIGCPLLLFEQRLYVSLEEPHLLIGRLLLAGPLRPRLLLGCRHFGTPRELECCWHLRSEHLRLLLEAEGELVPEGHLLVEVQLKGTL